MHGIGLRITLSAALVFCGVAGAEAKTLAYCSEASPEGFTPAFSSSNVTFDASSRQIYDRLLEFERGTTNLVPGLAEILADLG